jgi:hypothetical protein
MKITDPTNSTSTMPVRVNAELQLSVHMAKCSEKLWILPLAPMTGLLAAVVVEAAGPRVGRAVTEVVEDAGVSVAEVSVPIAAVLRKIGRPFKGLVATGAGAVAVGVG